MQIFEVLKSKGSDVITIDAGASVRELVSLLADHKIGAVLVASSDGRPSGIVSERDIVRRLREEGERLLDCTVGDIMTSDVVVCAPSDSVFHVLQTMTERRFRHLPVLDGQRVVGLVSIGDLVKSRIDELQSERDQLTAYISGSPA
jgi:CBS domain-containing protein